VKLPEREDYALLQHAGVTTMRAVFGPPRNFHNIVLPGTDG
jgi:hypothetical protein